MRVGNLVHVCFISENQTIHSGQKFQGIGQIERLEDGRVFGKLKTGLPFMCNLDDVVLLGKNMKIEDVKDEIINKSPLDLTQLFSREELLELRDQIKAKRASLIESRDKCSNGNSIALFNLHLGECKALSSRINQSITMLDMNNKMLKKQNSVDQQLATRFFAIAKQHLDPNLFNQLKEKALTV